ncbi:MAG: hypothetical protein RLY16_1743 [Bacteroidota bacterium]|jgi:hypothetical protein
MRRIRLISFLICWGFTGFGQNFTTHVDYVTDLVDTESRNWIFYQSGEKLAIRDFKMEPDNSNSAIAITMSGFAFKAKFYSLNGVSNLQINVYCNFDTQKSWMKPEGQNPVVLNHEQKHFDLTYLYCLRFIKRLRLLQFKPENYKRLLLDTHKEYVDALAKMQQTYDKETSNGIELSQQKIWNEKIANWVINEKMY